MFSNLNSQMYMVSVTDELFVKHRQIFVIFFPTDYCKRNEITFLHRHLHDTAAFHNIILSNHSIRSACNCKTEMGNIN